MGPLKRLVARGLTHRPYHLAASLSGEVVVACSLEGAVTLLSDSLRVLGSLELGEQVDGLAVSPDGDFVGLSLRDRTCVLTARGEVVHEVRHEPWLDWAGGGCMFSPDGRRFWSVRPGGAERVITVEVVESDGWQTSAAEEFEAEEDGDWTVVIHPEGQIAGLWLGAGQDGQWLYWCALMADRLYVEEEPVLDGIGPPVFHPSGGEFLTDSLDDRLLRRHRFPDGKTLGRIPESVVFPPDDSKVDREGFGAGNLYLSDRRALALSTDGRMSLLDLKSNRFEAEVFLEGCLPRLHRLAGDKREALYGAVEQLLILRGGRLLAAHRDWIEHPLSPDYELGVWEASSLCSEMAGPGACRPYTEAFFDGFLQ